MNKGNWFVREYYDGVPDCLHDLSKQKGPFETKEEAYDFGHLYFDGYSSGSYTYTLWNSKTEEEIYVEEFRK